MTGATKRLAVFASELQFEQLPPEVPARIKALLLDLVGIAVRARHDAESTPSLMRGLTRLGLTGEREQAGGCSVIGDHTAWTAPAAALINGTLAHSLDFDDTHATASLHTGAPIIPAALAAGEISGADGRAIIAGIVAGIEVQVRLSKALTPKDHYARGFHPTATCGAFGAAAAAARVLGLAPDRTAHALGIALSQTAGSMAFLAEGAWTKRYQVGHAAMNGVLAATLADAGFEGPADPVTGRYGFLTSYAPDPTPELATADLGSVWETLAVAVKPYPSCRYSHAAMDAVIDIAQVHGVTPGEVDAIEIGLPRTGWHLVGEPEADKQAPESVVDGQFSMPFLAAVALREHGMSWDDYDRHLSDPETLALCRKVRTRIDERAEAAFPAYMSGGAEIVTSRGNFQKFVTICRGEPENFPAEEELRAKFDGLAAPYVAAPRRAELADAISTFEQVTDMGALLRLTRRTASLAGGDSERVAL